MSPQGHRARKRFGQNFLHDPGTIERIVRAVAPRPGQRIVEIGPGLGALTAPLVEAAGHIDVVEIDRDLVARLRRRFTPEQVTIHEGDALAFDFRALAGEGERLRIVGNLPYNISTPLLFHLMEQLDAIESIHCMLQREVVERMAARPGEKSYGRLGVMIQYHCRVTPLFRVGPGAFRPAPKVESAVARLTPHPHPPVEVADEALFATVVAQAFGQRRKTLRNALRKLLPAERIEAAGIDPGARPETLDLADFAALANAAAALQREEPDTPA